MNPGKQNKRRDAFRYLKYLKYRIGYDSLPMFILDVVGKLGIYIQPFYVIQEGLYEGMDEEFSGRFSNLSFRYLDKGDMEKLASHVERNNIPLPRLISHLDKGRRCLGCLNGDDLVAFSWFSLDSCLHPGYSFKLKGNEAYLFDAYTLAKYRGCGIGPYVRYRLYKDLEKLGRTVFYSVSEQYNKPAVRLKRKLKGKIIARGTRVVLFNRWGHIFNSKKPH